MPKALTRTMYRVGYWEVVAITSADGQSETYRVQNTQQGGPILYVKNLVTGRHIVDALIDDTV